MSTQVLQPSTEFLRELTAFVLSLSEAGIVVYSAHFEFGSFGSWSLEYGSEDIRFRLFYDGRDNYLTLSRSPVRKWSAPNEWSDLDAVGVGDDRYRSSIPLARDLLAKHPVA